MSRFNVFLPPVGKFILPGPETWRVPNHLEGLYAVLLRIEAANDANPGALIAGREAAATGGVAGFSLPVLRYYVGAGTGLMAAQSKSALSLDLPGEGAVASPGNRLEFSWNGIEEAAFYRIEFQNSQDKPILSATLLAGVRVYRAPSWLKDRLADGRLQWRVIALDRSGNPLRETPGRMLRIER